MPQTIFREKDRTVDEQKYIEFKNKIRGICDTFDSSIKDREVLENLFIKEKKLESEYTHSKPEEFTKRHIIEELFDFLGYEKKDITFESELKRSFGGNKWPDYKLSIKDFAVLVEAKPINEIERAVKDIKDYLDSRRANVDYGIATDGFSWVLIKYGEVKPIKTVNIKRFFLEFYGQKVLDESKLKELFGDFYTFSKKDIKETVKQEEIYLADLKEQISKKFYDDYTKYVFGFVYNNKGNVKEEFTFSLVDRIKNIDNEKDREYISQTIIDRLIFIKFLESKGFLKGNTHFLTDLHKEYEKGSQIASFYKIELEQLFFNVLNNPKPPEGYKDMPYLNGGLFRKTDAEIKYDFDVENDVLKKILFEFFDKYEFKIKKGKEEAGVKERGELSPEILGYIFEKTINHELGSYYTPDQITQYIAENTIHPLIIERVNNVLEEYKQKPIKSIKEIKDLDTIMVKTLYDDRDVLNFKILDNAVGSGHFLTSALYVLLDLHKLFLNKLEKEFKGKHSMYNLKKKIITENLYGVELQKQAVEICKLRLWLSLVEELESVDEIEPLPNIEYNILWGNTLIGFVEKISARGLAEFTSVDLEDYVNILSPLFPKEAEDISKYSKEPNIENLIKIKEILVGLYKTEENERSATMLRGILTNITDKMRNKINDIYLGHINETLNRDRRRKNQKALTKEYLVALKPFHWGFEFYNVMNSGGFDVIIGNPPYIRQESIKEQKPLYNKLYPDVYAGTADLSVYFVKRSLDLTKLGGHHSFIITNKWLRANYGENLRNYLTENVEIDEITDFNGVRVFIGAAVDVLVYFLKKKKSEDNKLRYCEYKYSSLQNIKEYVKNNGFDIEQETLKQGWNFYQKEVLEIKKKIEEVGTPLKDINVRIKFGIKTGFNDAFIIDENTKEQLIKKEPKSAEIIKPILRGRDIERYSSDWKNLYLIVAKNGINIPEEYPAIYDYLLKYEKQLKKRWDKGDYWYNLRHCAYYEDFEKLKIIYPDISITGGFFWDDKGYFFNNTAYMIAGNVNKSWVPILNSKLISWYYKLIASGLSENSVRYFTQFMEQLPIKTPQNQQPFIHFHDYMLFLSETKERQKSEKELIDFIDKQIIDSLVYELYFKEELKTNLLQLIESYLYEIKNLKSDEEKLKLIKQVVKKIKADDKILMEIEKIKDHDLVKIITIT